MTRHLFILMFLPFFIFASWEKKFEDCYGSITISKNNMSPTELLSVTLTLQYPSNYNVAISPLETKGFTITSEKENINPNKKTITYTLEPCYAGNHLISIKEIKFVTPDNKSIFLVPKPIKVNVELPKEERFEQNNPTVLILDNTLPVTIHKKTKEQIQAASTDLQTTKQKNKHSWGWIILLLAVLGLPWVIKLLKKKPLSSLIKKQYQTPKEKALSDLKQLLSENLIENNKIKEFYVRITSITRTYIEEQYHIKAPERTTQEFLKEALHHNTFDNDTRKLLQEFLFHADLVKFAKTKPSEMEIKNTIKSTQKFIYLNN